MSSQNISPRAAYDDVSSAWSHKNAHWIKHNSKILGCEGLGLGLGLGYFLSQQIWFLLYLQANMLVCLSFMDAGRKHDTLSLLLVAIEVPKVPVFSCASSHAPIPWGDVKRNRWYGHTELVLL